MNPSDLISGIAAAAGLFALWRTEQTRANILRAGWDEMRQYRGVLRPVARHAYLDLVNGKAGDWPKDVESLIGAARMPPNVPIRKGAQIRNWHDANSRNFNAEQRQMWEFSAAIYSESSDPKSHHMDASVVAPADREAFDVARRHMATFFHRQWEATSCRQLFRVVPHTYEDVVLLSWLELALIRLTRESGPPSEGYGGKRGLFKYGMFLQSKHDR